MSSPSQPTLDSQSGLMAETPELADRAAYFSDSETLVCADLHLGRGAAGRVELPLGQLTAIPERIEALTMRFEPQTIVLAGDILHSFTTVPDGVPRALDTIEAAAATVDAELVFVRGNHDAMLPQIVDRTIHDGYSLDGGVVVCHGHEPPETGADRYVIGHDHPAIAIEGKRRPCYLSGPHPDPDSSSTVFVLPSFTPLAAGVTVNRTRGRSFQSPMVGDIEQFCVAVRDEDRQETLWFPPLGEFQDQL